MWRAAMKAKLMVTIDAELLPRAKQYARSRGKSLSQLIEMALRDMSYDDGSSFSKRWRGKFAADQRDDERYRSLARKYL
jgi:hypothetical protein